MTQTTLSRGDGQDPPALGSVPTRARLGRGHPWLTLLALAFGVMMVGLDATVVAIANPAIARDLGADFSELQWVTNGYLLALAVSLIVAGRLADRFGRRRVFLIGVAGFAIASIAVGLSSSIAAVIGWRVVQGFAGALLQPASLAIVRNTFSAERLNLAIGVWAGTSGLAIASGPIVAGLMVENMSWEWVFFLNAPIAVAALALGGWVIRESRDPEARGSFDLPGVGLLAVLLSAFVYGLIKAQEYGFGDPVPLMFFGTALVFLAGFLIRQATTRNPVLPLGLFRNVSFSAGTALVMLGFFALFGAFFFLTLYMQQVNGLTPVQAGVRLLPMTATFIVASPLAGALTARYGPRPPLVVGMLLSAVALFALSRISLDAAYVDMWPWFIVIGFGFGFVIVAGTEAIVGNAPANLAGLAGGIQQTAGQLGGVLGTTVFGTVMATRVGDVLLDKLTGAGVPAELAPRFAAAEQYVSQGVAPVPAGAPVPLAEAVTTGSHLAFMAGLQGALVSAAVIAVGAAMAALLVRRGATAGSAPALA
jgi:EmrB/QacA subfamily drug resistance transporter